MSLVDRDGDLELEEVLEVLLDARQAEIHTAIPARVEKVAGDTVDATPVVHRSTLATDGSYKREPWPTVRAVPIAWPRSGDWYLHMPIAAGDYVLLLACQSDWARWRQTGDLSDPIDRREHHLAHAVAIPGIYPSTKPIADRPTDAIVLGSKDGVKIRVKAGSVEVGGTTALAQYPNLNAHLNAIASVFQAMSVGTSPAVAAATYNNAAKALLDASSPIGTTIVKGA